MKLIDKDKLCEDLLNRWSIADTRKEDLIRQVMADVVTPIIVGQPTIEPDWTELMVICDNCGHAIHVKRMDVKPTINEPQKWIPFHKRELTEEEQEMYPEWSYSLDCELPEDGEEILISSPTWGVYKDTFNNEGSDGCYLEGDEEIDDGMAWMPLPPAYKGDEE